MNYPKELKNSKADIKVLYEKTSNIEKILNDINNRLNSYYKNNVKNQAENERRFGELEERTQTTKYIVYSSLILAITSIVKSLIW